MTAVPALGELALLAFLGQRPCVLRPARVALPRMDHLAHRQEAIEALVEAGDAVAQDEDRVLLVGPEALVLEVRHLHAAECGQRREEAYLDVASLGRHRAVHADADVKLDALELHRLDAEQCLQVVLFLVGVVNEVLREPGLAVLLPHPCCQCSDLVLECPTLAGQKLVHVALDDGRDDVGAELGRELRLVLDFADLDDRVDLLLDPRLEDIHHLHRASLLVRGPHQRMSPRYMNSLTLPTNRYTRASRNTPGMSRTTGPSRAACALSQRTCITARGLEAG